MSACSNTWQRSHYYRMKAPNCVSKIQEEQSGQAGHLCQGNWCPIHSALHFYSVFSLDILCLLQGFKMDHNNLFLHTKPGTHLYLPGQALCLHAGRDPPVNQLIAEGASQAKASFKTALLLMHQNGIYCQVIGLSVQVTVCAIDEKFSGKRQFCDLLLLWCSLI